MIEWRMDGFDTFQQFLLPTVVDSEAPYWDLVITVRNVSGKAVDEYGQFFACYTRLNRDRSFWFWDAAGKLELFSDRGVTHLDGYVVHPDAYFVAQGAIPHCPRGDGKIVGQWGHPVIVSHASAAGRRSVILLEEKHTASLAHGIRGGAMDYIVFPGPSAVTFASGAEFKVHVRHVMLKSPQLPSMERMESLWQDFADAHETVHRRAASLIDTCRLSELVFQPFVSLEVSVSALSSQRACRRRSLPLRRPLRLVMSPFVRIHTELVFGRGMGVGSARAVPTGLTPTARLRLAIQAAVIGDVRRW